LVVHLDCVVRCLGNVELEQDSTECFFECLDFLFEGALRLYILSLRDFGVLFTGTSRADNVGRWAVVKDSNWVATFFLENFDAEMAAIAGSVALFADVVNDKGSVRLGTDTVNGVASFKLVKRL